MTHSHVDDATHSLGISVVIHTLKDAIFAVEIWSGRPLQLYGEVWKMAAALTKVQSLGITDVNRVEYLR